MSRNRLPKASLLMLYLIALVASLPGDEEVSWSAGTQRASLAEGKEYTVLSGGATVRSGETVIEADRVEITGDNFRYFQCEGDVRVRDDERGIRLQTDTLYYDRVEEITRVDGYVEMQDVENNVVVKSGYFEYLGDEDTLYLQIGVRILKVTEDSELTCRSEFARYNRADNSLELSGLPRVTRNGDEYSALRITINLDTDEITLEDRVRGTVVDTTTANGEAESAP